MLLLFDEVQTGWGRTGELMAYMNYGIMPDAVSMAKAMGGGMPIAAMCATNEAFTALGAGTHGEPSTSECRAQSAVLPRYAPLQP